MLDMVEINYIRRLRNKKKLSITDISEKLEINWRTAKRYGDGDIDLDEKPKRTRKSSVMETYTNIVDAWLTEDMRAPRKQQRTAKAIHDQLSKRTDFSGSARTISCYVSKRRKERSTKKKKPT